MTSLVRSIDGGYPETSDPSSSRQVHMCKQLPLPLGPVALASLKGYLVVSHAAGSAFLNTTSVVSRNPQELAAESSTNLGERCCVRRSYSHTGTKPTGPPVPCVPQTHRD